MGSFPGNEKEKGLVEASRTWDKIGWDQELKRNITGLRDREGGLKSDLEQEGGFLVL